MRFDYFCCYLRLYSHKCYYLFSLLQIGCFVGLFFFPLKISLNLPEPLPGGALWCPGRCAAASQRGEQHQPVLGFHAAPGPLGVSRGLQSQGEDSYKDMEVVEPCERPAEEKFSVV